MHASLSHLLGFWLSLRSFRSCCGASQRGRLAGDVLGGPDPPSLHSIPHGFWGPRCVHIAWRAKIYLLLPPLVLYLYFLFKSNSSPLFLAFRYTHKQSFNTQPLHCIKSDRLDVHTPFSATLPCACQPWVTRRALPAPSKLLCQFGGQPHCCVHFLWHLLPFPTSFASFLPLSTLPRIRSSDTLPLLGSPPRACSVAACQCARVRTKKRSPLHPGPYTPRLTPTGGAQQAQSSLARAVGDGVACVWALVRLRGGPRARALCRSGRCIWHGGLALALQRR